MNRSSDISNATTLRDFVFVHLQEDIIAGKYPSGTKLSERELSEKLGVSRTPVREAIHQLEIEGLVTCETGKSIIVNGITHKDILDIYHIRIRMEGLAARLSAENITEDALKQLTDAVDLEEFYVKKKDLDGVLKCDARFHEIIFRSTGNKSLVRMLTTFHNYGRYARGMFLEDTRLAMDSFKDHKAVMYAIANRNADKAEEAMVRHVTKTKEYFLSTIPKKEDNK